MLGPFTTRVSTLAMESGNVVNLQDFEQNEIPFKQRSFEDSIDTFLSLFDADLLLIWMNTTFRAHPIKPKVIRTFSPLSETLKCHIHTKR